MSWATCPLPNPLLNCFSSSSVIAMSDPALPLPRTWHLPNGRRSSANPIQQDTPLCEELSGEVTITDPTHPLFGQTLPLLSVRTHRSRTHVTVLLPTGRRRSVPCDATDLSASADQKS